MTPKTQKSRTRLKAKWLVRIKFVNDAETVFSLSTADVREFISTSDNCMLGSDVGIINKYLFPLVVEKFDNRPFKSIKIRGNYE